MSVSLLAGERGPLAAALAAAPDVELDEQALTLGGRLLAVTDSAISVIVAGLCLTVARDDVLDVFGIQEHAGSLLQFQVELVRGARLLAVTPAELYRPLMSSPKLPFAYVARTSPPRLDDAPGYRKLESAYREKFGLA